ncbi:hypothetical protein BGX28_003184 [Mortierella sp. GBA30]|nr:hypothetical protein BGX28_003184 [Mortierella sp. GBA30]
MYAEPGFESTIRAKAHHVRSITYHNFRTDDGFMLGLQFSRLKAIHIVREPCHDRAEGSMDPYEHACQAFFRQNLSTLESVTLEVTLSSIFDERAESPLWCLSAVVAEDMSTGLRSLTLKNCRLKEQHLKAACHIFSRLESLQLRNTEFEVPLLTLSQPDSTALAFPRLMELTLEYPGLESALLQLESIIRPCPKLKTLVWKVRRIMAPVIARFLELYSGHLHEQESKLISFAQVGFEDWSTLLRLDRCKDMTWPDLESVSIKDHHYGRIMEEGFLQLVQAWKHGRLKKLDIPAFSFSYRTFEALFDRQSASLCEIDLRRMALPSNIQSCIHTILSNCKALKTFAANRLHAQNIIRRGPGWSCLGLERLTVFIDMSPSDYSPMRKSMTTQEFRTETWAVYAQLARLRRLQLLDIRLHDYGSKAMQAPCAFLPLRLNMGLGQLSSMTGLETLHFQGNQSMRRKDIRWMIASWQGLKVLEGGVLAVGKSRTVTWSRQDCVLEWMLRRQGIRTRCHNYTERDVRDWGISEAELDGWSDGETESESESENEQQHNKESEQGNQDPCGILRIEI